MLLTPLLIALLPFPQSRTEQAARPPIEIVSPQERQVFQCDARGNAQVLVEALAPQSVPRLAAVTKLADGATGSPVELAAIEVVRGERRFRATIELAQGAWHALEIFEPSDAPGAPDVGTERQVLARVGRFGVGELFVIAGQSNSTNFGEERFASQDDRVSAFDGERWSLAADPMPGVQDGSAGGSPWPLFGKLVASATGVPVGIASVGFGGTSIGQWQRGVRSDFGGRSLELYAALRDRVRILGEVRAIVWHQGESDSLEATSTERYVAMFRALSSALREDTGSTAPWFVARASFLPGLPPDRMRNVREAQAAIWKQGLALQGPDTDDLLGSLRHKDRVHFSKSGLEAHAQRWFALVYAQLCADPPLAAAR